MTDQEIADLPSVVDIPTAGRALGISKWTAWALVRNGQFPIETFEVGSRRRVAKHKLLAHLGMTPTT